MDTTLTSAESSAGFRPPQKKSSSLWKEHTLVVWDELCVDVQLTLVAS
jgi:hypothetical protein